MARQEGERRREEEDTRCARVVNADVGDARGVRAHADPGDDAVGAGGRADGVPGPRQVGASLGDRCRAGLSQRPRQAAPAGVVLRHDRAAAPASTEPGGALREPGTAAVRSPEPRGERAVAGTVPAWAVEGRLRTGAARAAGRWGVAVAGLDRAA